jgi:hypothetical protein
MKNYAIIDSTGTVINTVLWNGGDGWQLPENCQAVVLQGSAGIGWTFANGKFIAPPEPPLESE